MKNLLALLAIAASLAVIGCGSSEKDVPETPASQESSKQAASTWTDEQKAAMQRAIAGRRGEKENGSK